MRTPWFNAPLHRTLLVLCAALALSACGSNDTPRLQGVFLDSAVAGLGFQGNQGSSGVTDANGTFTYLEGETLTFSVGAMTLGSATGRAIVTPAHLESAGVQVGDHATRVLQALQTLDSDANPANGITIPEAARQRITTAVNLAQANGNQMLMALQQFNPAISLVDTDRALAHFASTLQSRQIMLQPAAAAPSAVTLSLLHTNDTHSRMETFTENAVLQGGVARRLTLIEQARAAASQTGTCRNELLVDSGDFAQGTVFYNAWEMSESFMAKNAMRYDAITLGNHEFNLGPARLVRALRGEPIEIAGTRHQTEAPRFPVVSTNLDLTRVPELDALVHNHTVIERCGQRYGILGVVPSDLATISSPGRDVRVLDYVRSVNAAVALLQAQGVNKIILLSHAGFEVDRRLAPQLRGVDVVVSAHDHVLLGEQAFIDAQTGTTGAAVFRSRGAYPTTARSASNEPMLLVSAHEWGRWLGNLQVTFDAQGLVTASANQSRFVAGTVPENPALAQQVAAYRAPVDAFSRVPLGNNAVAILGDRGTLTPTFTPGVRTAEVPLGNLAADQIWRSAQASDGAVAAFTNGGGLRATLPAGMVTFGDALTVLPFGNTVYVLDLRGAEVLDLIERSVSQVGGGAFLQLSRQWRVRYCADAAACPQALRPGSRLVSVTLDGAAIDPARIYRLATNNFVALGGDGYAMLPAACARAGNFCRDTGILQLDLLVADLRAGALATAAPALEGRIVRE